MNIVLTIKRSLKLDNLKMAVKKIEPVLQEKSVSPTTSDQTITPDENYNGLSQVNISAVNSLIDSNIRSENIKDGITILGTTGDYKLNTNEYFYDTADINGFNLINLMRKIPRFEIDLMNYSISFSSFKGVAIDLSGINSSKTRSFDSMFSNCVNLKEIDVSVLSFDSASTARSMFYGCTSLEKIDIRNFEFTQMLSSYRSNMFSGVPDNCLIIVKNETEKNQVLRNYSNLTNVKTVEEYEES